MKHWSNIDYIVSHHLTNWTAHHPRISYLMSIFSIFPYQIFIYFISLMAIFLMLIYGWNSTKIILFPFFFGTVCIIYMQNNIFRLRPGCRYGKFKRMMDPVYCDHWNAYNSMPSKQVFLLTTMGVCVLLYFFSTSIPEENKYIFFKNWNNPYLINSIISVILFGIILCSFERIAHGYNYLSDVLVAIVLGYIIGYISYRMCIDVPDESAFENIEWIIIRIIAAFFCFGIMTRFFVTYIPHIIRKTKMKKIRHKIRKTVPNEWNHPTLI